MLLWRIKMVIENNENNCCCKTGEEGILENILKERNLPPLKSKDEMLEILLKEEYGYMPPKPEKTVFSEKENFIPNFCAGKAISKKVEATVKFREKTFTFPFYVSIPKSGGKHPFFICINFRDCVPDRYIPVEEIIDNGFAVISFCYKDITSDDGDFENGLAGVLYKNGKRGESDAGKIAMWAWAAQRVMDYAQTLDCLDFDCSIVCGHSRLGKTALLTAATDERFKFAFSNNSGCSGAAISRGKGGETIEDICRAFPFRFCENYLKYINSEVNLPFDQHFLLAANVPHRVYAASAAEDLWADPDKEYLSCVAASDYYKKHGMTGFVSDKALPGVGDVFHDGHIGYHLRKGKHYFSREDWNRFIEYLDLSYRRD